MERKGQPLLILNRFPRPVRNAGYAALTMAALAAAACGGSNAENGNGQNDGKSVQSGGVELKATETATAVFPTSTPEVPKSIEERMLSVENCKGYASVQEREAAIANTVKEMKEAIAYATTKYNPSISAQNTAFINASEGVEKFAASFKTLNETDESLRIQHFNKIGSVYQAFGNLYSQVGNDASALEAGAALRCAAANEFKGWISKGYYHQSQLDFALSNSFKVGTYNPAPQK